MTVDRDQFYEKLADMKEECKDEVEAHMPTFEQEFGESLQQAREQYEVTKSTDQWLLRSKGVLEIVRTTEDVSDEVRYIIAHMLNVFLLRDEWVQGTKIDVFMSSMTQQFGEESQRIHTELSKKEHADILKPISPAERN